MIESRIRRRSHLRPKRPIELLHDLVKHILRALPVLLVVCFAAIWFGNTALGKELRGVSYRTLQRALTPAENSLRIQIVDIGEMRPEGGVTSREKIKKLIGEIVNQNPSEIGVDIDFSPEIDASTGKEFLVPGDFELFQFALDRAKEGIPVFLGVHRSIAASPRAALGLPQFERLAGTLIVEKEAKHFVVAVTGDQQLAERERPELDSIPSLSTQLSNAWISKHRNSSPDTAGTSKSWIRSPFCATENLDSKQLARRSLIDFSAVERFQRNAIRFKKITEEHAKIEGAVVLLGDIENASDVFVDPATNKPIPGVLLHAAGVYTKLTSPLCEVEETKDIPIDLSLAVLALVLEWAMLRVFLGWHPHKEFSRSQQKRAASAATIGITVAILGFGLWVNTHRIFWEGFIPVALSIAIHPFAGEFLERRYRHFVHYLKG